MGSLSLLHNNFNLLFLFHHSSSSSRSLKCFKSTHTPTQILITRTTKLEAQNALMDYLHSTRRYTFSDAEFITKNSPHFINSLISKINNNNNNTHHDSFRKFLRYNPINEFEPFFESLGINKSQLKFILPKDMFFLSDDSVLLDNFHVLCNHGVPRNRMGKIFSDAREVFGYDNGVLSKKFNDYENLGLSKSTVIKLVVCCPLLLVGDDVDSDFVVVLDWLKKIGIESEWIVNCMSCSKNYSWKRMLYGIEFLHQVGFSDKHMYNMFKEDPRLLLEGLGKKMYLFLGRLIKLGVDVNLVCSCFVEHPYMLSNKCVENLMSVITFFYNIRMEQDDMARILSEYMHIMSKHSIKGYRTVCKELGVGKVDLCQIIKDDPFEFISLASKPEEKRVEEEHYCDPLCNLERTNFLLKLGYTENSEEMEEAVNMFRGRGDQLQERFDCLVEAGLDYNAVIDMIKRVPMIVNLKRDLIQKKIDFLKKIGYPVECLVLYPTYFCYDLDKIFARFSMYAWLKERNAVNPNLSLSNIVSSNEKRFVKYFVNMHPEGPTIWQSIKSLSSNLGKN